MPPARKQHTDRRRVLLLLSIIFIESAEMIAALAEEHRETLCRVEDEKAAVTQEAAIQSSPLPTVIDQAKTMGMETHQEFFKWSVYQKIARMQRNDETESDARYMRLELYMKWYVLRIIKRNGYMSYPWKVSYLINAAYEKYICTVVRNKPDNR
jgi:hypothetical protein